MEAATDRGVAVTLTESCPPCTPPKHSSAIIKGREYNWRHLTNGGGLRLRQRERERGRERASKRAREGGSEGGRETSKRRLWGWKRAFWEADGRATKALSLSLSLPLSLPSTCLLVLPLCSLCSSGLRGRLYTNVKTREGRSGEGQNAK